MKKAYERERKEFIRGERRELRVGGYGGTVHLTALRDGVRIKRRQPKIEQLTLDVNSRHNRRVAVDWAESHVEEVARRSPRKVSVPASAIVARQSGPVTAREIWLFRFEALLGSVPPEVFGWGRAEVVDHLERMNRDSRAQFARVDTACGAILAARRLHQTGIVPLDVDIGALNRVLLRERAMAQIGEGWSPWTAKTYLRRFRTAVREHKLEHSKRWGEVPDPTEGMKKIRTHHIKPPEIGEERARHLLQTIEEHGDWRLRAGANIANESGRRVGAFGGHRSGQHMDVPPLVAADIIEKEDGRLYVTWRGLAAKAPGEKPPPDQEVMATRELERVLRWVMTEHPNPLGPEYPLIWDEKDPTKAVAYEVQRAGLTEAWQLAFGEERPKNVLWHGFCRTLMTTLHDEVGVPETAEYAGRTEETVLRYLRSRGETGRRAADALDRVRGDRLRPKKGAA